MNNKNISITKLFGSYPFAHRQPSHGGCCRYLHGHSWFFEVTFEANKLDECGFIMDFGKMKAIKEKLAYWFDHTFVTTIDDNESFLTLLREMEKGGFIDPRFLPRGYSPSAEGLAVFVAEIIQGLLNDGVNKESGRIVMVTEVTVCEDEKNSATYKV